MTHDLVFTIGGLFFTILLIPALLDKEKPPVVTSAGCAFFLLTFVVNYATLDLWLSAAVTLTTAILWATLAVQRWSSNRTAT